MAHKCTYAAVIFGACLVSHASFGQSVENFYKGRTITIYVGHPVGGSYDAYARILAKSMGKYIPGRPNVIVSNLVGAATLTAVRYLDNGAPKDGTAITAFNPGLITSSLIDPTYPGQKLTSVSWLGSITPDAGFCYAWHTAGLKTWDDVKARKEIIFAGEQKGNSNYMHVAVLNRLFGINIRHVVGYEGSAAEDLALERGEVEARCGAWAAANREWVANGNITPFFRTTAKLPEGMPASAVYAGDVATTQEQKDILQVLYASSETGRPYVVSKQVPQDRLTALREAFDKTMIDPQFKQDADKANLPIEPISGADAEALLTKIYQTPADLVAKAKVIAN